MKKCMRCGKTVNNAKIMFCPDCGGELSVINRAPSAPAAPIATTDFCMYCGSRFNEFGVCPQCGNRAQDQSKTLNKPEPYGKKLMECVKAFFSSSPFNGIENAGRETKSTIWPICAGAFVLFLSLVVTVINVSSASPEDLGKELLAGLITTGGMSQEVYFFKTFIKVIITTAAAFFVSSALLWLPLNRSDKKLSYVQLMNVNAFALLPVALVSLVALAASLFSTDLAMCLIPVGAVLSGILLYYAIQKLAAFKSSPFWYFAGALAGNAVLCWLCSFVLDKVIV
ncbi:MAG: YIP1 family protein [Ruminococcaceae bacterium]|nr:YIP1 family protein [Oscillospiraceae bacterium]